jgi:prepilin-type processing-associated H-X9-DG protein
MWMLSSIPGKRWQIDKKEIYTMKRRSYTLIELLTVIFVIAVLAGLIMPATALVRSRAKRTNCASNLKQVGMLAMQFTNDRNGLLLKYDGNRTPTLRSKNLEKHARNKMDYAAAINASSGLSATQKTLWTASLVRYAKYDMEVFHCPADERNLNLFDASGSASYGLNYGAADRPGSTASGQANNMTAVKRTPAGVILFGETSGTLGMDTSGANASAIMGEIYNGSHKPHSQYYNISFLDGHTETLQTKDLSGMLGKNYHRIAE